MTLWPCKAYTALSSAKMTDIFYKNYQRHWLQRAGPKCRLGRLWVLPLPVTQEPPPQLPCACPPCRHIGPLHTPGWDWTLLQAPRCQLLGTSRSAQTPAARGHSQNKTGLFCFSLPYAGVGGVGSYCSGLPWWKKSPSYHCVKSCKTLRCYFVVDAITRKYQRGEGEH